MATQYANGKIVTDGLVLSLDASDLNSYPGSGTTWNDLAGTNNGTLTNGPTFDSNGNASSIVFDGVDDRAGNTNLIDMTNTGISLEIFVKVFGKGDISFNRFLDIRQSSGSYCFLYWDEDDDRYGFTINGQGTLITGSDPTFNTWQHWIGTYDITTNISKFYINSQLEVTSTPPLPFTPSNQTTYTIGSRGDGLSDWSNIAIGVARIYNRALSAEEVTQNYSAQKSRFGL